MIIIGRIATVEEITRDIWNLYKKWSVPGETEDNCHEFGWEVYHLRQKFKDDKFAQMLIDAFLYELNGKEKYMGLVNHNE